MVQPADFGTRHDLPRCGELDRPEVGRVLVEREVCARLMVIGKVTGQDAVEVSLAENEPVIQALAPGRRIGRTNGTSAGRRGVRPGPASPASPMKPAPAPGTARLVGTKASGGLAIAR
jgi:hypothetical protein